MRYPALESLRGLAALVVVIHHHLLVLPALYPHNPEVSGLLRWLTYSPLHLVWAGGEAVIFFFVLSGFVLSLGVWLGRPLDMQAFIVQRLWRIWVPLMVAVTLAWACAVLFGHAPVVGASSWFNAIWVSADLRAYLQHGLMVSQMDRLNFAFIPVVWSLKWEMWLSLLLPVVVLLARQRSLIVATGCAALWLTYREWGGGDTTGDLMRYLPMFVAGAWLAQHRETVTARVAALPGRAQGGLLLLALLLIPFQWYGWGLLLSDWPALLDLAALTGASLLIVLALGWGSMRAWLDRPVLSWLGRISFSLYLYHALILTVVVRAGAGILPIPALALLSFLLTFPVAHLAHRWVEVPAMQRGRGISLAALPTT